MTERIQKILAARGVASRRQAEEMMLLGRVTCNGIPCGPGDKADPDVDKILIDGKPLPVKCAYVYIMLNKPKGYVTTLSDEKGRKNAAQLVDCGCRVYPVGRLDMDSEGLLLFTNDGTFANEMMHPKHEVNKIYEVTVAKFTEEALKALQRPVILDGYKIRPPKIELIKRVSGDLAVLHITIHEGRNRQVRRMCAIAGMPVRRLIRIAEGNLHLGDLPCGSWRNLTQAELQLLNK